VHATSDVLLCAGINIFKLEGPIWLTCLCSEAQRIDKSMLTASWKHQSLASGLSLQQETTTFRIGALLSGNKQKQPFQVCCILCFHCCQLSTFFIHNYSTLQLGKGRVSIFMSLCIVNTIFLCTLNLDIISAGFALIHCIFANCTFFSLSNNLLCVL
jgi:hypothetical protein